MTNRHVYAIIHGKIHRFHNPRRRWEDMRNLDDALPLPSTDPRVRKAIAAAAKGATWPIAVEAQEPTP